MKWKILNLYAGIGGNRKLWDELLKKLGIDYQIIAIEYKPEIAKIYQDFFPNDKVIVTDAHKYLLEHFNEFDFIWSSPPCPTHSVTNNFLHSQGTIRYPDMKLYEEIIFLKKWFKGKYCIENVISYYNPLIAPVTLDRHYFWANFLIPPFETGRDFNIANARSSTRQNREEDIANLEDYYNIKLPDNAKQKRLLLRNCVHPLMGKHILKHAIDPIELQGSLI